MALLLCWSACINAEDSDRVSEQAALKLLSGEYKLFFKKDNNLITRKNLIESKLTLNKDGTSLQKCSYDNGTVQLKSTWKYSAGNVYFEKFKDCCGAWPPSISKEEQGAHLTVEFTTPPHILVSSDLNVFYDKVK